MNNGRIFKSTKKRSKNATYIMMSSFRILDNHSLYYALENYDKINIVIYRQIEENQRNNHFFDTMVNPLIDSLSIIGKTSIVYKLEDLNALIKEDVVIDKAYLKEKLEVEDYVESLTKDKYGFTVIESNMAVPVTVASNKEEYSARTFRPKVNSHLYDYMDPVLEAYRESLFETKALEQIERFI